MNFALVLAVIFLVGTIVNLDRGTYDEAAVLAVISLILASLFLYNARQEKKIAAFIRWLMENKYAIKTDTNTVLIWNKVPVTCDSYVTQYQFCSSFLIASVKQPTGYILERSPNRIRVNITATLLTLIFGWWSLPWGPIYTIKCIFVNLRGGRKIRIDTLIASLEDSVQNEDGE